MKTLVWLGAGGCGGCSMSLLTAEAPDCLTALELAGIELLWHPSLSALGGAQLLAMLDAMEAGAQTLDILCVEGALLTAFAGQCQTLGGGEPMAARVGRLARVARHVVAVGGCAAFGGVGAADDAGIGGRGLQFDGETPGGLLGASFVAASGLPVVNVAGCPPTPAGCWTPWPCWPPTRCRPAGWTACSARAFTPIGWCITAARATNFTNSRPPPTHWANKAV